MEDKLSRARGRPSGSARCGEVGCSARAAAGRAPWIVLAAASLALSCAGLLPGQEEARTLPPPPPSVKEAPGTSLTRRPGGIVAIVGGDDVITQAELDRRVEQNRAVLSGTQPTRAVERELVRLRFITLDNMINDRMILQLVKKEEEKEGMSFVTEADVDAYVTRRVDELREKGSGITSAEDFYRMVREANGQDRLQFRRHIKDQMAISGYFRRKVIRTMDGAVSPEESKMYYKTHLDEFTQPVEISFRQIMIPKARDNAILRVEAVEKGLKEGLSFEELAKAFSEEALLGSPESAGRLWKKSFEDLKAWLDPIPSVLRSLKKGQISQRVETALDVRYFEVVDVVEGKPKPFSEAQEEIEDKIKERRNRSEIEGFIKRLRQKIPVEIYLTNPEEVAPPAAGKVSEKKEEPKAEPKAKEEAQPKAKPRQVDEIKPQPKQ
jgi:parvulin-like peptidyl-prolyl isomerase